MMARISRLQRKIGEQSGSVVRATWFGFPRTKMDSVVLETSLGDIQLELYWNHAPKVCSLCGTRLQGVHNFEIDMPEFR